MRLLVKAGLVAAGVAIFGVAWTVTASAEAADPAASEELVGPAWLTTGKPAPIGQMPILEPAKPMALGEVPPPPAEQPVEEEAAPAPSVVEETSAAPATPTHQSQVAPAPAHPKETVVEESALERAGQPLVAGFQHVGSYLERVVSACQVGLGSGAGVPVLALAVLSAAAALDRRRVLRIWSATDEDTPELLLASEVIKPG